MDPCDTPSSDGRPETLLAATILLMSAYAREGGGHRLAGSVLRHLELLADRDDLAGVVAATCDHAADLWVGLSRIPDRPAAPVAALRPTPAAGGLRALLRLVSDRGPATPGLNR
jgi:hypothetical protein